MSSGCWKFSGSSPEFIFKDLLKKLNKSWEDIFGWKLFLSVNSQQSNISNQLTVLGSDNQGACLKLIQRLNVILSESINVEALKDTGIKFQKNKGSITKLSYFLESKGIKMSPFINYLLQLNTFRSELTDAHRHSSDASDNFLKASAFFEFDKDSPRYKKLSIVLFEKANEAIQELLARINKLSL